MTRQEEIDAWIAEHGVTKCPPRWVYGARLDEEARIGNQILNPRFEDAVAMRKQQKWKAAACRS